MRLVGSLLVLAALSATGCASAGVVGQAPGGAPILRIPLRLSNVHVIQTRTPVLIDSGTVGDMNDLQTALVGYGMSMRSVGLVVLTHGHADHAGLASELSRSWGAKIMLGAGDVGMAHAGHNDELMPTSFFARVLRPTITDVYPDFVPDIAVREDAAVDLTPWGVQGKAIAMPGHTAGSIVVVLSDHSAFVGDMMMGGSFGGALSPSSPGEHYYQADPAKNRRNIQALLAMGVEKFYLGHGGPVSRADVIAAFPP